MPALGRPAVLADVVEEHFDELDFLWEHREANIFTPDWLLEDLAWLEARAEAHLDGLRASELHAVDVAEERIGGGETYAATASALVLFAAEIPDLRARIVEALRAADPASVDGVRVALRHCAVGELAYALQEIAGDADPFRAAAAADVLAFHRVPTVNLTQLVSVDEPEARVLALGAAGRLGALGADDLAAAMDSPEPTVRRAGLEAAARCGLHGVAALCRAAVARESDPDPEAVRFLGVLGDPADLGVLRPLLDRREVALAAIDALGAMGRVEPIPFLLELMSDDDLGVAATRAYVRITGADDVEGEMPFPPPEVPEGEDEDEALPPDPVKARADFERRLQQMTPDLSWQAGVGVAHDHLPAGLDQIPLESRRDVYLRLRSRLGSRAPDVELEALAHRQALRG